MIYLRTKIGKKALSPIWWTNVWIPNAADVQRLIGICVASFVIVFFSVSCAEEEEALYFTGSSLVEKWDVRKYFPTRMTYNMGLSGSGIAYIESQGSMFRDEAVVVITGGNDLPSINDLDEYANRYLQALHNMQAKRIYLFAILPRLVFEEDNYEKVRAVNAKIKGLIHGQTDDILYIDLFDRMLEDGKLNEELFYDGVHLNSWGYDLISEELNRVLP